MISNDLLKEQLENRLKEIHKELYHLVEQKIEANDYGIIRHGDNYSCDISITSSYNLLPELFAYISTPDDVLKQNITSYEEALSVVFGTSVSIWSNEFINDIYLFKLSLMGV